MNFQGKRVIIGGSSGIGLATATAVTAGVKVLIAGRSLQKLKQAQAEIGGEVEISSLEQSHISSKKS